MADISSLKDAIDGLKLENQSLLGQSLVSLDSISDSMSQLVEEIQLLREAMQPDAFETAQTTESTREQGVPIVGGPADNSSVESANSKPGMGMLGMLGIAAAGAAAGLVAAFAGFLDFDAEKVKQKVLTLTSIADVVDAADTAETVATLGLLGAGLAIFGAGSAIAGLSSALTNFTDPSWAETIRDNVGTLTEISQLDLGDVAKTTASLGLLGAGLAIFGAGSTVAGLASALTNFTDRGWAISIKDNVKTLVSISELPFGDVLKFLPYMVAISGGLAAFGVGSAVAGVGEAVAKFSSGTDWSQKVKDNVITLASVTDDVSIEKATAFSSAMGLMSSGLLKFGAGNFGAAFLDAGANIINFLSGSDSPIEQMMHIADREEDLNKGARALRRISNALSDVSELKFDGSKVGLQDFAEDLLRAVPAIETAIMGGKLSGGIMPWADDIEFKGLASPDIKFEEAIVRIMDLTEALGRPSASAPIGVQGSQTGASYAMQPAQAEYNENVTNMKGGSTAVVNQMVAPTNISNASTTNLAGRNQHIKPEHTEVMVVAP